MPRFWIKYSLQYLACTIFGFSCKIIVAKSRQSNLQWIEIKEIHKILNWMESILALGQGFWRHWALNHGLNLWRRKPKETLKITDESVDISLARCLQDNVLIVIVSHGTRHLLVVHLWFILPQSPSDSHLIRIHHLELPAVSSPTDDVEAGLVREELQQELPQLDGTWASEARTWLAGLWQGWRRCERLLGQTEGGGWKTRQILIGSWSSSWGWWGHPVVRRWVGGVVGWVWWWVWGIGWSWAHLGNGQVCVGLAGHGGRERVLWQSRVIGLRWHYWALDVSMSGVCLPLKDLKMRPEDVSHEERSPADEVLLIHGAQLSAWHAEAGDETVYMLTGAQTELSDCPSQPVRHVLLWPVTWVTWYPQLVPHPVPCAIRGLEHVTDALHVTGLSWGCRVGAGWHFIVAVQGGWVIRMVTVMICAAGEYLLFDGRIVVMEAGRGVVIVVCGSGCHYLCTHGVWFEGNVPIVFDLKAICLLWVLGATERRSALCETQNTTEPWVVRWERRVIGRWGPALASHWLAAAAHLGRWGSRPGLGGENIHWDWERGEGSMFAMHIINHNTIYSQANFRGKWFR